MTTELPPSIPSITDWDDDFAQMDADVKRHTAMVQQRSDDKDAYQGVLEQFNTLLDNHHPEQALLYFLYACMASANPQKTGNLLGMSEDQYGIAGTSMAVMGDVTKLTDDLQNCTNGSDPNSSNISINDIYNATGELKDYLNHDDVKACFDPEALSTIQQQLGLMQDNITQHFNLVPNTDPNKLNSIGDMIKDMGLKGDPNNATEAAQGFTDPESVMTSSSQSINAELNQEVSTETSFEKNEQSFMSSLIKSMIDETNTAVQNQSKQ
jgi:hypothetical protein